MSEEAKLAMQVKWDNYERNVDLGNTIVVRMASDGEKLTTLDNIEVDFDEQVFYVFINGKLEKIELTNFYVLKAQYLYNTKKFQESLNVIDEYVKVATPDALSFQMKALIYEELNDDFNAHLNWGFCYKVRQKFDDAIVEFNNAYQINQKDKTVLIELANLYQQAKERFVAIEFWEKVYALDKDERAREILAEFYYSEGNFDKAEEYGKIVERKEENYAGLIDKIMAFFTKEK